MTLSKGKRSKKRKRASAVAREDDTFTEIKQKVDRPPRPLIEKHVTVGLNSTIRHLEERLENARSPDVEGADRRSCRQNLAAIFLTHPKDYLPYRHLPTLAGTIAKLDSSTLPILLIPLPEGSESKLSAALGTQHVSLVGVYHDAPNGTALIEYTRDNVAPVDVQWVHEAATGK